MRERIWQEADRIVEKIRSREPKFGDYKISITEFGATACSKNISKEEEWEIAKANAKAIYRAVCHVSNQKEGGTVVVPDGVFYTGPIHLEGHVNLHLKEGAVLCFGTDTRLYTGDFLEELYGVRHVKTRFEGVELMNYSPFIYAYEKECIAITGKGTLDGQASEEYWHPWKQKKDWSAHGNVSKGAEVHNLMGEHKQKRIRPQDAARVRLFLQGEQNIPVEERIYGEAGDVPGECDDGYLRPSFVQPYCCKDILIEGIRMIRSPMWEIHPVLCENVSVRDVHIDTHLSNNDGVDPECCKDVLIENCYIDVGDDCIAIKSGRNQDARRIGIKTENVVIQNNIFADGHGGITIGSEVSSGVRGVYVRDNVMESPRLWSAMRFKTNDIRGGTINSVIIKIIRLSSWKQGRSRYLWR